MTRFSTFFAAGWVGLLIAGFLGGPSGALAETYVGTNIDERVTVAVKVSPAAVQAWLPEGWEPRPTLEGALAGANLMVVFVDRLMNLNVEGSPAGGGAFSVVGLIVPALHVATAKEVPLVLRIYGPHEGAGPYKNSLQAEVSRQARVHHENIGTGTGSEMWQVRHADGGELTLDVAFQRELPVAQSL